jgi:hypothetical protein
MIGRGEEIVEEDIRMRRNRGGKKRCKKMVGGKRY